MKNKTYIIVILLFIIMFTYFAWFTIQYETNQEFANKKNMESEALCKINCRGDLYLYVPKSTENYTAGCWCGEEGKRVRTV